MSKADHDDPPPHDVVQIKRGPGKWRYTCPHGHTDWRVINHVLECRTCKRHAQQGEDVDPNFRSLIDTKTGEEIPRERVEIVLEDETIKW
jgi:hypothetical protein